jgi:hypothetical protein
MSESMGKCLGNMQLLSDFDIGWLSIICLTLDVENNLTNCRVANILDGKMFGEHAYKLHVAAEPYDVYFILILL